MRRTVIVAATLTSSVLAAGLECGVSGDRAAALLRGERRHRARDAASRVAGGRDLGNRERQAGRYRGHRRLGRRLLGALGLQPEADRGDDRDGRHRLRLWLWRPGSTTVFDSDPDPHVANASQTRGTSTESFWYPASSTGTYYLDVFSDKATSPNKGPYRLVWSTEQLTAPDLTYAADRTLVKHDGTVTFSGTATFGGSALATNPVLFQRRLAGSKSWTPLNAGRNGRPTTLTSSSGAFVYKVRNVTRKAEYRAIVWPGRTTGWRHGAAITVTPRVYLTRPRAPKTVYRNQKFAVRGYLKPRHASRAKTVKVTAYHADSGVWRYAKNYNYSGYTQYRMSLKLPHRGRWKLVATTYADSYHAATQSKAAYVTVK